MKILLDECLPKKLKREIIGDSVVTLPEQGWAGTKNGKLLKLAEKNFDVFITADQNLTAQQNLAQIDLIIIVLIAKYNCLNTLKPLVNQVNKNLELAKRRYYCYRMK